MGTDFTKSENYGQLHVKAKDFSYKKSFNLTETLGGLRASDWSPKSQSNSYYIKRKEVHEKDRCTSIVSGCEYYI